jgi:hypothetical protein
VPASTSGDDSKSSASPKGNTSTQAKNDRHIRAANRIDHDDDDGGAPKKRRKKKPPRDAKGFGAVDLSKHKPKKPLTDRSYSNKEWKAMKDDERAEVRALRDAKKSGTGGKMGSVTSITDEPPAAEAETNTKETNDKGRKGGNAGNYFGLWTHITEKPTEDPEVDPGKE